MVDQKKFATLKLREVWAYLWKSVKPFPFGLFMMCFMAVVYAVNISVKPYLLKMILNRLAAGNQADVFSYLALPIILYLCMTIVLAASFRAYGYFVEINMIPRMRKKIANDAFDRLLDKSHNFYENQFSGSLTNKVNDLTNSVAHLVQLKIDKFFSNLLTLVIAIFTLWHVRPIFAVVTLGWTALFITVSLLLAARLTKQAAEWSEYASLITGQIVDALSNILSIRLFSAKHPEKIKLSTLLDGAVQAEQKLEWSYFSIFCLYSCSIVLLQALNFYFLCTGRQEGWITVGDFALVLGINLSIMDFLWQLAQECSQFSKLWGRITQALCTLLEKPVLVDRDHAKALDLSKGQITFDQVKFHYKGTDALFQGTSITIKSGQKVGLVGYSGGGKSTFVHLILRLYDVTAGAILIDGQDIRDVTQDSLWANIGMIPQDPSLFHRSLMENIRYGRMDATEEEVIAAAKQAFAHEFIKKLPQGKGLAN